jgi:hypothetical protein
MARTFLAFLLVAAIVGTTLLSIPSAPQQLSSPLSDVEMEGIIGGRCGQAASSMAGLALVAGYSSIAFPAASLTFFAFAVAVGAGVAIWC